MSCSAATTTYVIAKNPGRESATLDAFVGGSSPLRRPDWDPLPEWGLTRARRRLKRRGKTSALFVLSGGGCVEMQSTLAAPSAGRHSAMTRGRARVLAWSSVAVTIATIPVSYLIIARPHPVLLQFEKEGSPLFVYVGVLAFSIVGALIVSRHPRHLLGWIYCLSGLAAGLSGSTTAYAELGAAVPGTVPAVAMVNAASGILFLSGFFVPITIGILLFPDGSLPSPRWRPAVYAVIASLVLQFAGDSIGETHALGNALYLAGIAGILASTVAAAGSLVVRWRRAPEDQRQQLKWVAFAGAIVLLQLLVEVLLFLFRPALIQDTAFLYFSIAYACVPIAVGIAILRYGLYHIDLFINRAIVYVSLTAFLGGVYEGITKLSERVLIWLTGSSSEIGVVITVFVLITLFTPTREWIQVRVDRRFKNPRDLKRLMGALEREVAAVIDVVVGRRLAERLLRDATEGASATGAALYLDGASEHPTLTHGNWDGQAELTVPLRTGDRELGRLALGRRRSGVEYSDWETARLQRTADTVAHALSLTANVQSEMPIAGALHIRDVEMAPQRLISRSS